MTDYLVYIYEIQPDNTLKEIEAIGLVENEKPKADSPKVFSILQKNPEGMEDTGNFVFQSRKSTNYLKTIGQAILSLAGWED
jgi:hypothetical protein